jgi:hypothetical protein
MQSTKTWVEEIIPGFAAHMNGELQVGDVVVAIDGEVLSRLQFFDRIRLCQYCHCLVRGRIRFELEKALLLQWPVTDCMVENEPS